jgi:hypothetical protein
MAERAPLQQQQQQPAEVKSLQCNAFTGDAVLRRSSDMKPRRGPYRPSVSTAATSTTTHVDVTTAAAAASSIGTPPLRPTAAAYTQDGFPAPSPSLARGDSLRSHATAGVHSRGNSLSFTGAPFAISTVAPAGAERSAEVSIDHINNHNNNSNTQAHTTAAVSSPMRPSLPEALIQQVRNTPYNPSANRPAGSSQHRRTVSSISPSSTTTTTAAAVESTASATEALAATTTTPSMGAEGRRQLRARAASCPSPAAAGDNDAAAAATQSDEVGPTTIATPSPRARRPLYNPSFSLSFNSVSEAPLTALTCSIDMYEVFASSSPAAAAAGASSNLRHPMLSKVAHIMQRESIRQLLSRALMRWILFYQVRHHRHHAANVSSGRQRREVQAGVDLHISSGACGATVSRSLSAALDDSKGGGIARPTSQSSGITGGPSTSPLPPWRSIAGGGVHSGSSAEDHDTGSCADSLGGPDEHGDGVAQTTTDAVAAPASLSGKAAGTGGRKPGHDSKRITATTTAAAVPGSAFTSHETINEESFSGASQSSSSSPKQRQQGAGRTHAHRSDAPSAKTSLSAKSSRQHSPAQQLPAPLRGSDVPAFLPSTNARRNFSPGAGNNNMSNNNTISLHLTTTPRQQTGSGEPRRKSIVSQYLAGKPPGSLSPQQSSSPLFTGSESTASSVVEVHSLELPNAMSSGQQQLHSFPRRRSDGPWSTTNAAGGPAGVFSDSEDRSHSSLYFTPRSRQSNGVGGVGASFDDDPRLSNSSLSTAAVATSGQAAAEAAATTSPVIQSIPQLCVREEEKRSCIQCSEVRRRCRMQGKMSARMDQLLMAALHRRSSERGLHPSLRTSAAPSLTATSHQNSSSSDSDNERTDLEFVSHSRSVSEGNGAQGNVNGGRCSAPRSPGRASTRSSSISAAAVGITRRTCPRLSAATTTSSVSRRLSHTRHGTAEATAATTGDDNVESLSDISRDDEGDAAAEVSDASGRRRLSPLPQPQQQLQHSRCGPLHHETPPRKLLCAAASHRCGDGDLHDDDDDDEGADTATAQSEGTVHGLATTRQWVSQQTPETAAAAAAAAVNSGSLELSFTSMSLSQPQQRESSATPRT